MPGFSSIHKFIIISYLNTGFVVIFTLYKFKAYAKIQSASGNTSTELSDWQKIVYSPDFIIPIMIPTSFINGYFGFSAIMEKKQIQLNPVWKIVISNFFLQIYSNISFMAFQTGVNADFMQTVTNPRFYLSRLCTQFLVAIFNLLGLGVAMSRIILKRSNTSPPNIQGIRAICFIVLDIVTMGLLMMSGLVSCNEKENGISISNSIDLLIVLLTLLVHVVIEPVLTFIWWAFFRSNSTSSMSVKID